MPRYYFDLVDDRTVYDSKGVSLPNEIAAKEYAATFARELMETKKELLGETWEAWKVRVSNGRFKPILNVNFSELKPADD